MPEFRGPTGLSRAANSETFHGETLQTVKARELWKPVNDEKRHATNRDQPNRDQPNLDQLNLDQPNCDRRRTVMKSEVSAPHAKE